MKCVKILLKLAAALAAVGAALFVVYKYWDKILEKLDALKSKCFCCTPASVEEPEEAPEEENSAEEAQETAEPAQEEAPAEEAAPAQEETVTEEDFAE